MWEVLGGLGLFILGMKSMSEGLQKIAGERLRFTLEKITGNRLTAALLGSCLASLLQSNSAASVLVVGFVNAGLISIYQALGVLLGTGLGTTIAIQFIAFKISSIALPAVFLGVGLTFFSKKRRVVYLGNFVLGGGLVFLGLQTMENGFSPVSHFGLLKALQNEFFSWRLSAAILGALLTFFIQSGSAATGIVIAMTGTGLIGYETGAAMVVGEVIGASAVAITASINGTLAAKRTAFLYMMINTAAVTLVLLFFPFFLKLVHMCSPGDTELVISSFSEVAAAGSSAATKPFVARHLANAHTIFNLLNIIMFLPLVGFLARTAAPVILPGKEGRVDTEPRPKYIDRRVINTPTIALLQAKNEMRRMADITRIMYDEVVQQFYKFDVKRASRIQQKRDVLNILQREISTFLILLSRQALKSDTSMSIPIMLHMVGDLKHIGDQNQTILELLRRKKEDRIVYSGTAMSELKAMAAQVGELVHLTVEAVGEEAERHLQQVSPSRNVVMAMHETMLNNHMQRLTAGKCSVAAGMSFSDISSAFVKIADFSCTIMEMEGELIDAVSVGSN